VADRIEVRELLAPADHPHGCRRLWAELVGDHGIPLRDELVLEKEVG
jgi:hypothetical protein